MSLGKARKILLCLRYGIGDLVMETPALEALRRAAPDAFIVGMGARPALELLEGDRRLDSLICVQEWGLKHWGDRGSAAIRGRIAAWIAGEGFDLVIDPSHAAAGLAEAIRSCALPLLDAGDNLQESALRRGRDGAEAIRQAVGEGWGIEVPEEAEPRLQLGPENFARADAFLRRHHASGDFPVGFSPVASSPLKRWPLERFARIIDEVVESSGSSVLLFHGPQREAGAALAGRLRHPRRVVPVGELHLRDVAALLARCRLFVGHDTGLMHMAAAVGTPLVALFGPTSPQIYLPRQGRALSLGGDHPCRRRLRWSFGPPECVLGGGCLEGVRSCIDQVSARGVSAAIRVILGEEGGNGVRMQPAPVRPMPAERGETDGRQWPG